MDPTDVHYAHLFVQVKIFGGGSSYIFPRQIDQFEISLLGKATDMHSYVERDTEHRWACWRAAYFSQCSPERPLEGGPRNAHILSAQMPRAEYIENFLSDDECDHMIRLTMSYTRAAMDKAAGGVPKDLLHSDQVLRSVEERIAALTRIPCHEAEDAVQLVYRPPLSTHAEDLVANVHLDARLGRPFTCATVLVYLNTVPEGCGGGTVFPSTGADNRLKTACTKIMQSGTDLVWADDKSLATGSLQDERKQLVDAANIVARGGGAHSAGVVSPARRGAALVFYTINDLGGDAPWTQWQREPMAWHGGVDLLPGGEGKWIMQKFKELPVQVRDQAHELLKLE